MNKNWLSKVRKGIALGIVTATTMVSTIVPVLGNEAPQPQISQWSIGILNEGEKYGIYPIEWYTDGFWVDISEAKLNTLLTNVEAKLADLGLSKDETFSPIAYEKDGTRGAVLTGLYNILASYKLPEELEKGKGKAIQYMQERGLVNGTNNGLALEQKATVEQAAVFASRLIEDTYDAIGAGAKGLIWEVNNGGNKIYLLGSIHLGDPSLYPMHKAVKDAFKASDVLIVEANVMDPQGTEEFIKIASYPDGTKLYDHISEETYEKYGGFLTSMGLPADAFDDFKPWFAGLQLSAMTGSDSASLQEVANAANLGIDMYFLTTGMLQGKPAAELEGMVYQGNLFNDLSEEKQIEFLEVNLELALNPDSETATQSDAIFSNWIKNWVAGDIDGFANSYVADMEAGQDELDKMLLGKRDQDMADKLAQLLEKDGEATYFVVVGALHLVTQDMVVDQLKNKGYTVNRFWE